ncbi:MAG: OmpP1/FadL family transporter [Candidatus Zixiibacteriota bacterium]
MRMKRALITATALYLVTVSTVSGQNNTDAIVDTTFENFLFDFAGGGARAEGMGKAFIGVSDDITAGSWNPAGLWIQEVPAMSGTFGSLVPRGEFAFSSGQAGSDRFRHNGSFGAIDHLSFVAPIRIKGHHFVGSFSWTRNFDQFESITANFVQPSINRYVVNNTRITDTLLERTAVTSELQGGLNSVSFAFGTRMYRKLSIGIAAHIYTGQTVRDELILTSIDSFLVPAMNGQRVQLESGTQILDTNTFSGINFTIGLKYNSEKLDAGLVIRKPFSLDLTTDVSQFTLLSFNGFVVNNGTDTIFVDDILRKYEMPLMIAGGIGYKPREDLVLALDLEYRQFGTTDLKRRTERTLVPGGTDIEEFEETDPDWQNTLSMRLGVEYVAETGIGAIPFRAGLGIVPIPQKDSSRTGGTTLSYQFPHLLMIPIQQLINKSKAATYSYSVGTGIHWSQIHFDFAYTYSTLDQRLAVPTISALHSSRNHHVAVEFTGFF